eukprot:gnl/Ergobibamus_cyprinoides/339.p2 GENE.gnl/Ergobibamus_cyprinoides/339~~gnl/Ergobibamus_cyprinoides/339.p2  ORF type:complete len:214 (+),score=33.85 gnl/Ergobibamus_cyprinoides/339:279-920(+)
MAMRRSSLPIEAPRPQSSTAPPPASSASQLASPLRRSSTPFEVLVPSDAAAIPAGPTPHAFIMSQEGALLHTAPVAPAPEVPAFRIAGLVDSTAVDVDSAVTGFVRVEHAPPIRTVEVQLARVEHILPEPLSAAAPAGPAQQMSEVLLLQVGDGDVARGVEVPFHIPLPRLFTAPSLRTEAFALSFALNVGVHLQSGFLLRESIPLRLFRRPR